MEKNKNNLKSTKRRKIKIAFTFINSKTVYTNSYYVFYIPCKLNNNKKSFCVLPEGYKNIVIEQH